MVYKSPLYSEKMDKTQHKKVSEQRFNLWKMSQIVNDPKDMISLYLGVDLDENCSDQDLLYHSVQCTGVMLDEGKNYFKGGKWKTSVYDVEAGHWKIGYDQRLHLERFENYIHTKLFDDYQNGWHDDRKEFDFDVRFGKDKRATLLDALGLDQDESTLPMLRESLYNLMNDDDQAEFTQTLFDKFGEPSSEFMNVLAYDMAKWIGDNFIQYHPESKLAKIIEDDLQHNLEKFIKEFPMYVNSLRSSLPSYELKKAETYTNLFHSKLISNFTREANPEYVQNLSDQFLEEHIASNGKNLFNDIQEGKLRRESRLALEGLGLKSEDKEYCLDTLRLAWEETENRGIEIKKGPERFTDYSFRQFWGPSVFEKLYGQKFQTKSK